MSVLAFSYNINTKHTNKQTDNYYVKLYLFCLHKDVNTRLTHLQVPYFHSSII
jgi:hypothetical protein